MVSGEAFVGVVVVAGELRGHDDVGRNETLPAEGLAEVANVTIGEVVDIVDGEELCGSGTDLILKPWLDRNGGGSSPARISWTMLAKAV